MEKGEKSSPSPSRGLNFFDTANLLGPSPFGPAAGLAPPFAHLAHIPSAFSMLGRLPPFPLPPPFGGLGALADPLRASSALAHSSCASTGGAEWWRAASEHARRVAGNSTPLSCAPAGLDFFTGGLSNAYSPLFSTLAQGHTELGPPTFDMFLQPALTDKSSFLHNAFSGTSPLSIMSPMKLSSSLPSPSSSTSSKATSSKASTSSAINSGRNTSHSRKSPQKESSGKPRHKHRSSNSSSSVPASISSQSDYNRKKSLASNPFLHASSLLLGSEFSQLVEKPSESESVSDISSPSSLSSDESSASSNEDKQHLNNKKRKRHSHKHSPKSNSSGPVIQIDGAKKQLMADQIRQKMQGKLTMPPPPLIGSMDNHKSKGKGGNSKHSLLGEDGLLAEDHKKSREDLKRTLEARFKQQQQLELKLLKQVHGDREESLKHQHSPLNLHKSMSKGKASGSKISQLLPFPGDLESHKSKLSLFHEAASESNDHSDLSSDSDPELENDGVSGFGESSGDSEDSDQEKSTMSEGSASPSKGDKRAADTPLDGSLDGGSGHKRRRVLDEKELRIPVEHGWRRETRIRHVGSRGIAGEVVYYAPCGKKLKTYPDVTRYLDRNSITDLTRENFTFSSKYNIGDFMEARHGENGFTVLSEEEVIGRLMWAEKRKARPGRAQRQDLKRQAAQDAARQAMEIKLRRKLEQQEMARRSAEFKILRKMEKQRQKEEEKRSKHMKVAERKKQKDQLKMMKQHEKVQRQEQIRLEREMRAQQILEARRRRKEDVEKGRYEEALRKAQSNMLWYQLERDREMKRQQAVLLKEQEREWQKQMMLIANMERERRRQHMLLVKALEARKKQEEKDKIKEEKKAEKCVFREKKIEQRRLELQLAHEMKEPREDLELGDLKPLPDLNRLPGVKLPGEALADCVMVLEFLNTFGEVLGFDETSMPNLDTLQKGLMNETEDDVEELMSIFTHLTQFAVDDPGVPNPKESHTRMGQKISDVEITDTVVSEVLRIFIRARAGKKHELCDLLSDKPIEALNTTQKAAILAFLCNELLCSRVITSEIDNNIDNMANLRRDKWVIEGKLRKLRIVQSKKFSRPESKRVEHDSNSAMSNSIGGETDMETSLSQTLLGTPSKQGSDDEEESGHESEATDTTTATGNNSEEDDPGTAEECEKKIEKLTKQHSQYRNKVFNASHKLRGSCFGQDRYKRWYWVLPYLGGVFVEGMESGEPTEQPGNSSNQTLCDPDQRTVHIKQQLEKCKQEIIKLENGVNEEEKVIKTEPMEVSDQNCTSLYNQSGENTPVKAEENGIDEKCPSTSNSAPVPENLCNGDLSSNHLPLCKEEENKNTDKLLQSSHNSLCAGRDNTNSLNSKWPSEVSSDEPVTRTSTPVVPSSPLALTNGTSSRDVSTPESKPSFLSIDSMLKKDDNAPSLHSNNFVTNALLPNGPFSAEQMLKNLSDRQNLKPWFSILPRLSCDNSSGDLSSASELTSRPQLNNPLSFLSPVHFPAFQLHNPNFPSPFQMGQIGVSPSDYNLLPLTPKNSMDDSFKVPNTPLECPATSNSPAPSDLHKYEPVEPIPIPDDCQLGWWRITECEKFKELVRALHPRGIRERDLQKAFQKNFDFVSHSCTKGNKEALEIEDVKAEDEEEEETTETKEEVEETKPEVKSEAEDSEKVETEEAEGSEEKPDAGPSLTAPTPDDPNVWNSSVAFEIESAILEEVEAMENRIFTASLQVKGWKLPQKVAELDDVEPVSRANTVLKKHQVYPLTVAKDKLLHLEKNIERRYLKPPFSKSVQIKVENMTAKIAEAQVNERRRLEEEKREDRGEDSEEEDHKEEQKDVSKEKLPAGLVSWRMAVNTASSPAQLALCLHLLNRSIAWEKSIMKVLCQLCRKDDNEAELLLCDSCDKGYHTYCFKPKLVCIPDGDWYCYECISKATGLPHCAVCGKKTGKLLECGTCPRAIHMDCMETPLAKTPKKWFCAACVAEKSKNKKGKKKVVKKDEKTPVKDTKKDRRESESTSECATPEPKSKKTKNTAIVDITKDSEDLEPCRLLLPELEKHADSWPFLQAVNTKQFPQYKKYIKHPMDFSTMRNKLRDNGYKCRGEFASDARQVFDNCETFNEDDSEVGKAGHNMRKLFEQRWKEVCAVTS